MHYTPYSYNKIGKGKYTFVSVGERTIIKRVQFKPLFGGQSYNLSYGDLKPNGEIDDMSISNNGDIIRIFATIIDIVQDFIERYPSCTIHFSGNTAQRTGLYNRILRTYYQSFSKKFIIKGYREAEDPGNVELFDPSISHCYLGFFIKKII